jgi:TonB family protein
MTPTVLHLTSLAVKIALLGGIAWLQLYFMRRAPASSRSRLCSLALVAILLLGAVEFFAPAAIIKAPVVTFTAAAARSAAPARPVVSLLTLIWLVGAGVLLIRAAAGRAALAMIRRRSVLLECSTGVDVRIGDVQTPILIGLIRPAILLPETARQWTDDQRSMVLTHELTHYRQGDTWTNLLAQTIRAIFWFHPVVWRLVSRLSQEQELTCDEAVVVSGYSAHDYAHFLLEAVRNLKSREMFACAMAGSGARSLKVRFANLLDSRPRPALTRRMAALAALFSLAAVTMSVVGPVWAQTKDGKAYKVGGGVLPPKLLSKVDPIYTPEAKAAKIEGTVVLKCIINAEGAAEEISVVTSLDSGLDQRAIDAVSQWTFQPGTKDGQPVAVWANIEVHFRLR